MSSDLAMVIRLILLGDLLRARKERHSSTDRPDVSFIVRTRKNPIDYR
jgi:hypothetical protein